MARPPIVVPLLTAAAKKFSTPKNAVSAFTGVDPGRAGVISMMLKSENAQAPVLDVTETERYKTALQRVNEGRGESVDLSNWNPTALELPPTYKESLQEYQNQQKQVDDAIVRNGGIRPSDTRVLQDTNRYNARARAQRFIPGTYY